MNIREKRNVYNIIEKIIYRKSNFKIGDRSILKRSIYKQLIIRKSYKNLTNFKILVLRSLHYLS